MHDFISPQHFFPRPCSTSIMPSDTQSIPHAYNPPYVPWQVQYLHQNETWPTMPVSHGDHINTMHQYGAANSVHPGAPSYQAHTPFHPPVVSDHHTQPPWNGPEKQYDTAAYVQSSTSSHRDAFPGPYPGPPHAGAAIPYTIDNRSYIYDPQVAPARSETHVNSHPFNLSTEPYDHGQPSAPSTCQSSRRPSIASSSRSRSTSHSLPPPSDSSRYEDDRVSVAAHSDPTNRRREGRLTPYGLGPAIRKLFFDTLEAHGVPGNIHDALRELMDDYERTCIHNETLARTQHEVELRLRAAEYENTRLAKQLAELMRDEETRMPRKRGRLDKSAASGGATSKASRLHMRQHTPPPSNDASTSTQRLEDHLITPRATREGPVASASSDVLPTVTGFSHFTSRVLQTSEEGRSDYSVGSSTDHSSQAKHPSMRKGKRNQTAAKKIKLEQEEE